MPSKNWRRMRQRNCVGFRLRIHSINEHQPNCGPIMFRQLRNTPALDTHTWEYPSYGGGYELRNGWVREFG